jgi:Ca-activated chloride channel homolog
MRILIVFFFLLSCINDQPYEIKEDFLHQPILSAGPTVPTITVSDLKQYDKLELLDENKAPDKKQSTLSPYFHVQSEDASADSFPLKDTKVNATISGVIADVNIRQVYKNEGEETIEAIYVFPMSTKAAVYGMTMTIGDRRIAAEIQRKEEARANYEEAKQQGKTASLLEQKRPNVFQMNVANILPGDEIHVDLRYTELLVPTEQTYEFVFPTVVGPRFSTISDTPENQDENWVQNPYLEEGKEAPAKVSINVDVNAPFPIRMAKSPSHGIDAEYSSKQEAHIALANANQDRDFILQYKLAGKQVSSGLMVYEGEEENFFLAMVEPPAKPTSEDLLPREYIYIVDVSGSMRGFPLSVSKAIIGTMLKTMRPSDYFNILFFAGGNQVLSEKSLPVTQKNVAMAQQWLSAQNGGGGTQLLPAMKRSLELPKTKGTSRTIAIVTDGYVTVEQEVFELIKNKLGEANMFTYGIGSAVNRFLIEGMARAGQGESFVVTSQHDALVEGTRFANYILNPVLTDIDIKFKGIDVYDVSPGSQPDLFASRPVVVYGKFKGKPNGSITISGSTAGEDYSKTLRFSNAESGDDQSALVQLWARNKIYELDDLNHLAGDDERIEEVTQLGLQYNLLTKYTSFVAIDKEKRGDGVFQTIKQPAELPQGVGNNAVSHINGTIGAKGVQSNFGAGGLGTSGYGSGGGGLGVSGYGSGGGSIGRGSADAGEGQKSKRQEGQVNKKRVGGSINADTQAPVILGSLDKSMIDNVIKRRTNQLAYCYQRELVNDPSLSGKIVVKFVIDKDGSVTKSEIKSSTMNSKAVEACITKRFKTFLFPKPQGGGIVIVSYPFVFSQ